MKQFIMTKYGRIEVERNVVEEVAKKAATQCYGVLGIGGSSAKDSVMSKFKKEKPTGGVQVRDGEEGLILDLFVRLQYGVRTTAVAQNIMETVKYQIESILDLVVEEVNVFVENISVGE